MLTFSHVNMNKEGMVLMTDTRSKDDVHCPKSARNPRSRVSILDRKGPFEMTSKTFFRLATVVTSHASQHASWKKPPHLPVSQFTGLMKMTCHPMHQEESLNQDAQHARDLASHGKKR